MCRTGGAGRRHKLSSPLPDLAPILLAAAAGLACAGAAGLAWRGGPAAHGVLAGAVLLGGGGWFWHAAARDRWLPFADNFDALLLVGLATAAGALAVGVAGKRGRWAEAFLAPAAAASLLGAAAAGAWRFHVYPAAGAGHALHRAATYSGAVAAAVAGAAGLTYLILHKRLRDRADPSPRLGSLASLERVTFGAAAAGFGLLSVGLLTGLPQMTLGEWAEPKLLLSMAVWATFGLAVATTAWPRRRAWRSAVLSVAGFALMVVTVAAVQWM